MRDETSFWLEPSQRKFGEDDVEKRGGGGQWWFFLFNLWAEGGSRLGHVKIDATGGLHSAAFCSVVDLPKPREPAGLSRGGDRDELSPAADIAHHNRERGDVGGEIERRKRCD